MSVYRINLADNLEFTLKRKALSAPTEEYMRFLGKEDNVGYREVEKVKKGDVILLCRGIKKIQAVALVSEDCMIVDVDAYSSEPSYFEKGFRLLKFDIINILWEAVDGEAHFQNFIDGTPFSKGAMGFCFKVYPNPSKIAEFNQQLTRLLKN
jgi:hypothetical protein